MSFESDSYGSEAYGDAPAKVDPTSGRLSPDTAKEALFIADFQGPLGELSGRNLVMQQIEKAATRGFHAISAFEYEFYTFEETPRSIRTKRYRDLTSFQPENRTYSALAPAVNGGLFDAIEGYLKEADIWLDSMHSELGPGCFEFPLAATEGMRSADNAALFRLFVRICLQRRGLMPVFMAKWSDDWPGQSGHLHLSLRDEAGTAVFHDPDDPQGVSETLRHFVGGVTRLLPETLALCSHTVNAYRRLVPGAWAPIASTWGIQNRTAAVRVIPGGAAATRIEFRVPAADANPHLALALLLGAGLWGLENKISPPAAIEETSYDRTFPKEQRFPRTLLEAAERLAESQVAQEIFGKAFIEHFVGTRLWEDQRSRQRGRARALLRGVLSPKISKEGRMATGFLWHERYMWHSTGIAAGQIPAGGYVEPDNHIESVPSKRRFRSLVEVSGLIDQLTPLAPRYADEDELLRFHTQDYLDAVKKMSDAGYGDAGELAPIGPDSYDIARLSAGGCIAGLDAVLEGRVRNAYVLNRPPGHHAEADRGRGFCILANVVIAVLHGIAERGLQRVATFDWDVHHGNGTQKAFYGRDDVLTISVHQDNYYPQDSGAMEERGDGAGKGYNINVPLPAGSGHGAYVETVRRVVVPALERFRPDVIVVPSGFDASAMDPLGRQMCISDTYREMTGLLMEAADRLCEGRLLMCHEGGYSQIYVPWCGLATVETLSGRRTAADDPYLPDYLATLAGQGLQPWQREVIDRAAALLGDIR